MSNEDLKSLLRNKLKSNNDKKEKTTKRMIVSASNSIFEASSDRPQTSKSSNNPLKDENNKQQSDENYDNDLEFRKTQEHELFAFKDKIFGSILQNEQPQLEELWPSSLKNIEQAYMDLLEKDHK